jgi:ribosome-associated protein
MRRSTHDEPAGDAGALPPSKTRRKADMLALQELGERMAGLPAERLGQLGLPEDLQTAILDYRRFTKWEAKRRQMQYIGRLMREIDPAPIAARMDAWAGTTRAAVAGFHEAEEWRERLLSDVTALDALVAAHPAADRPRLAKLLDQARAERAAGRPPAGYRQLFREIARLLEADRQAVPAHSAGTDDANATDVPIQP